MFRTKSESQSRHRTVSFCPAPPSEQHQSNDLERAIVSNALTLKAQQFLKRMADYPQLLKSWFRFALNQEAINVVAFMLNHFVIYFLQDRVLSQQINARFGRTGELDLYPFVFLTQLKQKKPTHYAPNKMSEWNMLRAAIVNHLAYATLFSEALLRCNDEKIFKKMIDQGIPFFVSDPHEVIFSAHQIGAMNILLCLKEFRPHYFTQTLCADLLNRANRVHMPSGFMNFLQKRAADAPLPVKTHRVFSESEKLKAVQVVAEAFSLASHL